MKKPEREALDAYFAEGDSWARDRQDMLWRSLNMARIAASVATVIAVCEAFALMALAPLKSVQPYALLVDRQTGFVQALKPLDPQLVSSEAALTQSFLVQYVIAREEFDFSTVQTDYRKVALWSSGQARTDYLTRMQASNPESPLSLYSRSTTIDVHVKSVTPMGSNVTMVRFDTRRRDAGGQMSLAQPWVAAIRYSFSNEPMSAGDRFVNPLGFKVLGYRRSPEVLSSVPPQSLTAPDGLQPVQAHHGREQSLSDLIGRRTNGATTNPPQAGPPSGTVRP